MLYFISRVVTLLMTQGFIHITVFFFKEGYRDGVIFMGKYLILLRNLIPIAPAFVGQKMVGWA